MRGTIWYNDEHCALITSKQDKEGVLQQGSVYIRYRREAMCAVQAVACMSPLHECVNERR